jgi:hypothetical protein
VLLNVPSEDLDVYVPDAPNLDIAPADVDTEEQDPVSSVRVSSASPTSPSVIYISAPVAAISEPITEVDSVLSPTIPAAISVFVGARALPQAFKHCLS